MLAKLFADFKLDILLFFHSVSFFFAEKEIVAVSAHSHKLTQPPLVDLSHLTCVVCCVSLSTTTTLTIIGINSSTGTRSTWE